MDKKDLELLWGYYFGIGKAKMIWIEELHELHEKKDIKKIIEIYDNDYNEIWYLIKNKKDASYIIKNRKGNEYSREAIKPFRDLYNFFKITTDIIKMYDSKLFPIIFKISEELYKHSYIEEKNINNAFFRNYYCISNNKYYAVKEFRNKVEHEQFDNEKETIMWCSNMKNIKSFSPNSKSLDILLQKVYEYPF